MTAEVSFSRNVSVADHIARLLESAANSVVAALYRFNNPQLAEAVADAARRGLSIRMVLDNGKYQEDPATRQLLNSRAIPFRLLTGRAGAGSKMHDKFAVLDNLAAITGSYNWTLESENENYESLVILHEPAVVEAYRREFELLWEEARETPRF